MFDHNLAIDILHQIQRGIARIQLRFASISSPGDFTATDDGLTKLDAICMMFIAIGESLKNLDKITNRNLLIQYPQVDWKGAKGVRDVISHHYFDLDAEIIYFICEEKMPILAETINLMISDLKAYSES